MTQEAEQCQERKEEANRLREMTLSHVCAICGAGLQAPWDATLSMIVLRCSKNKAHEGVVVRPPYVVERLSNMRVEIEGYDFMTDEEKEAAKRDLDAQISWELDRPNRKKEDAIMANQTEGTQRALAPYKGAVTVTENEAKRIITTLWLQWALRLPLPCPISPVDSLGF